MRRRDRQRIEIRRLSQFGVCLVDVSDGEQCDSVPFVGGRVDGSSSIAWRAANFVGTSDLLVLTDFLLGFEHPKDGVRLSALRIDGQRFRA